MPTPPTTNGKLSDLARHVVVPDGITATGWPSARDTAARFGVTYDGWQDGAGRLMLSKRDSGLYACGISGVLLSIPRQVGKTFLIGSIVFALCLLRPGLTVLWTAHRTRTANETFEKMQAFAKRSKVKAFIAKVVLGSGDEEVRFHNGSRILFGARERGFGRGFDDVDVIVFDEAQILTETTIDDMVPTTNTARNPLLIFMGTPPKPGDPCDFFVNKRAALLSGEDPDGCYIEFSADPDCDPMDRKQWAKANPSYPKRTPEASMLRMLRNLGTDSFAREALGCWPEDDARLWRVIPKETWEAGAVKMEGRGIDPMTVALEVSSNLRSAALSAAGPCKGGEGIAVLAVSDPGEKDLTGWLIARCTEAQAASGRPIMIDKGKPADKLSASLEAAGIEFTRVEFGDVKAAATDLYLGLVEGRVLHQDHPDQAPLSAAVAHVAQREHADTFLWDRKQGAVVLPFLAASLALWGSRQDKEAEPFAMWT